MSTRALYTNHVGEDGEAGFWKCAFFACDAAEEELTHEHPGDAIASKLDDIGPGADADDTLAALRVVQGETITVYGFSRMPLDPCGLALTSERILEDLLDELDEDHGNGDATEPTQKMRDAATALVEAVRADYVVWQCEQTHSATVNVEAWVRAHRPDWLTNGDAEPSQRGGAQ